MSIVIVPLQTTPDQHAQLCRLRSVFAQVCNELTPEVQRTGVWDRVALHHLHYRALREKYPELGSQMVCNAIYAVSKICRAIYQSIRSTAGMEQRTAQVLPSFRFAQTCPVYFDRHTLSIVSGGLSLFTMDGRVRFELQMPAQELEWFKRSKLLEIVLQERHDQVFELHFELAAQNSLADATPAKNLAPPRKTQIAAVGKSQIFPQTDATKSRHPRIPDYVYVEAQI